MSSDQQHCREWPLDPTAPGLFADTHWSVVRRAQNDSETALGALCESYRQPLLVWLHTRGYSPEDAKDLVQGFLAHLLRREFFHRIERKKGRFRTFLLACLRNYVRDQRDRDMAVKRGAGEPVQSLGETDQEGQSLYEPATAEPAPDEAYDRAWAHAVLANALRRLEAECAREGHSALCRKLEPAMFADETAARYQTIGTELGLSEGAVNTAAHRIRARLKWLIGDEVRQTVASHEDWTEEIRYLVQLFGR